MGGVCTKYSDKSIGKLATLCESFDPEEEQWSSVAALKKPVAFASVCRFNDEKVREDCVIMRNVLCSFFF